jgi:ribosomal-protein-serine acetyltransferase
MFRRIIRDDLYLALLEERHAEEVFAVVDRERAYLRKWLPWVDPTRTADDILKFIKDSLQQFASNEGFAAGIWSGEEFAGVIGTHKVDWQYRKAEMGYWIASKFQGRGIVTDAARAVIDHAFVAWKLNRVEIHCATGNAKSCAIPQRLGFQFEGVHRQAQLLNGSYLDINVYSLLAGEWNPSR